MKHRYVGPDAWSPMHLPSGDKWLSPGDEAGLTEADLAWLARLKLTTDFRPLETALPPGLPTMTIPKATPPRRRAQAKRPTLDGD